MKNTNKNTNTKFNNKHTKTSRSNNASTQYRLGQFNKRSILILIAMSIILSAIVYCVHFPSLSCNAQLFDDDQYLINNPLVKKPSLQSAEVFLKEISAPSTVGGYYQPLAMISLMCDYYMGGKVNDFHVFHTTSLILHILNMCLIMLLLYILFNNIFVAGLTALMFGVHPMTVETIAWVGERKTTLAAFFTFLCIIFYVLYTANKKRNFYVFSLILFIFALMSKPTCTMLPAAFILFDFWPLKRADIKNFKSVIIEKIPFFLTSFISAIITYTSQKNTASAIAPGEMYPAITTIWRICHNIMFYPVKMIFPKNLSPHYPIPKPFSLQNPEIFLSVLGTAILICYLVWMRKKKPFLLIGFGIFFTLLLPTTGIIGFTMVIASDKYAYLPSIGFLMIIASFLTSKWTKTNANLKFPIPLLISLCILTISAGESYAVRNYLTNWENTKKMYSYMINFAPDSAILYYNYAVDLRDEGNLDEAINYYKKAIVVNPTYTNAYNNLGSALNKKGRLAEAAEIYKKALTFNKKSGTLYYNLGNVIANQGDITSAINYYKQAIALEPKKSIFYVECGKLLLKQGKTDEAIKFFNTALKINPNDIGTATLLKTIKSKSIS